MSRRGLAALVACLGLGVAPAWAQGNATRYLLAPSVLQTDLVVQNGEPGLEQGALQAAFRENFDKVFPGGHQPLDMEHKLDPDQSTVLVVPRLSVVRVSTESFAGTLDRFEATLVGDVTLMDPWTMTRLFSATRLVSRSIELTRGHGGDVEASKRTSLDEASRAWIKDCLEEIRDHAHPFLLKAAILPRQDFRLSGGGGLWPYGSKDGVKTSTFPMGPNNKKARVRELFPHFSVLEDTAKPNRTLDPDEVYQATLVGTETPGQRPEPKVAIRWVGPEPLAPSRETGQPPDRIGWSELLAAYFSKSGGLRVLPIPDDPVVRTPAWIQMKDQLERFSMRVGGQETLDVSQAEFARKSQDEPADVVVEIGLADAYHGVAFGDKGSTDHQFHAVWGLRWFERDGDAQAAEDAPRLLFKGVRFQDETQRKRTLEGLRELDLGSVWFKLCREGLIKLARGVADQLHSQDLPQTGLVQKDQTVAWSGQPPSAGTRLTRRRAKGKVFNGGGALLGTYFSRKETLALDQLSRCDPGDELTFDARSTGPLVGLLPLDLDPQGPGFLRPEWARARLAELLLKARPMALTFLGSVNDSNWGPEGRFLKLKVDTFSIAPQGELLNLGAAWRFRYYRGPFDPTTEPVSKLGFQRNAPLPSGRPYQPDDLGGAALEFQRTSLEELLRRANTQGLLEALTKE